MTATMTHIQPETSRPADFNPVGGKCDKPPRREVPQDGVQLVSTTRSRGVRLLKTQHRISVHHSRRQCSLYPISSNDVLWVAGAGFAGLKTCSSPLCCVCSVQSSRDKCEKIQAVISRPASVMTKFYLVTLTIDTDIPVRRQIDVLKKASQRMMASLKRYYSRHGCRAAMAKSYDVTFDIKKFKTHAHLHCILGIDGEQPDIPVGDKVYGLWSKAVSKFNVHTVRPAFYCKELENTEAGVRYLMKNVLMEVTATTGKTKAFGSRVSWFGLLSYINQHPKSLRAIKLFRDFEEAMTRTRWTSIPASFKLFGKNEPDSRPELCDGQSQQEDGLVVQTRRDIHLAMMRAGKAPIVLALLFARNKANTERLRTVVDMLSSAYPQTDPDTPTHLLRFWVGFGR